MACTAPQANKSMSSRDIECGTHFSCQVADAMEKFKQMPPYTVKDESNFADLHGSDGVINVTENCESEKIAEKMAAKKINDFAKKPKFD